MSDKLRALGVECSLRSIQKISFGKTKTSKSINFTRERKKEFNFSLQFTVVKIEKTPLARKLLIFTVSACSFTNCTFMIPCSVLETFILKRKAQAFAKWRNRIMSNPFDLFLKTLYLSLQNNGF